MTRRCSPSRKTKSRPAGYNNQSPRPDRAGRGQSIYEVSQTHLDICSRSIAEKLNVTKPSVVRIMNLLMDRGMIVKEHYGKIYLTDRGIFVAKAVRAQLETVLTHFPPVRIDMTEEERYNAALALTSALPERAFTGEYDRLFGPDESEKENAS